MQIAAKYRPSERSVSVLSVNTIYISGVKILSVNTLAQMCSSDVHILESDTNAADITYFLLVEIVL